MYPNAWMGKNFKETEKKVLILGESHYGSKDEIGKVAFTTQGIVEGYLREMKYLFFTRIAKTFGCESEEEIKEFYDHVCFGNYVNVVVDKDDKQRDGRSYIKNNKQIYNQELFDFCKSKSIDIIVCFSKEAYWNLPSGCGEDQGKETIHRGKRSIKIKKWLYKKGVLELDKDLLVYGLPHPTGWPGYDAKLIYQEYIKKEFKWSGNRGRNEVH